MSLFNSLFLLCFSAFGYLSRGLDLLHSCIYSPCSCLFHLTPPLHEYPGSNQSKIHFALVHAGGSPQWTSNRHYECKTGQHFPQSMRMRVASLFSCGSYTIFHLKFNLRSSFPFIYYSQTEVAILHSPFSNPSSVLRKWNFDNPRFQYLANSGFKTSTHQ